MTEKLKQNILLADFDKREYHQPKEGDWLLFDITGNVIDYREDWNLMMSVVSKINHTTGKYANSRIWEEIMGSLCRQDKEDILTGCENFIVEYNKINSKCK